MADLDATRPGAGLGLPLVLGACRLDEGPQERVTAVQPFVGHEAAVDDALAGLGLRFPGPGGVVAAGGARIVWAGRATAFLIGADVPGGLAGHAALTDQGDGWATLHIDGAGCEAVLARLVPLDLRAAAFAPGTSARTMLNHLPALLVRTAPGAFEIRVFRSMTATAVHELAEAMRSVAARAALG